MSADPICAAYGPASVSAAHSWPGLSSRSRVLSRLVTRRTVVAASRRSGAGDRDDDRRHVRGRVLVAHDVGERVGGGVAGPEAVEVAGGVVGDRGAAAGDGDGADGGAAGGLDV